MGDMADYITEQNMDALALHHAGMCRDECEYCEADDHWRNKRVSELSDDEEDEMDRRSGSV